MTLIEAVVGVAIFSMLLTAILSLTTAGYKTQIKAFGDSRLETEANELLNLIVVIDMRQSVPGLYYAYSAKTDPANSALAFHAKWSKDGTSYDKTLTYYLSGGKLYRTIVDWSGSLVITASGGTEVAANVAQFALSPDGTYPVELKLSLERRPFSALTVQTAVKPRNLKYGP